MNPGKLKGFLGDNSLKMKRGVASVKGKAQSAKLKREKIINHTFNDYDLDSDDRNIQNDNKSDDWDWD